MEENMNVATGAPATDAVAPKEGKKFVKRIPRRKVCAFCQNKVEAIDYKDAQKLRKYLMSFMYLYVIIGAQIYNFKR